MAVKNALAPRQGQQRMGMAAYLTNDAARQQINSIVGKHSDTFITSIVSAVQATPALQDCTKQSILSAALLGEGLKLSPSPQLGHYYMIPFKNTKMGVTEAQFQIGYKGLIQLAIRSGQYKKINVLAIKEGELVRYDPLEETIEVNLIEDDEAREKAPTIGYYAMFEYMNGFRKTLYWTRQKMESHARRYSKGYAAQKGYTFWEKDFDGMAIKTMLRQLISRWGIMSVEMQRAYDADQAVIRDDGTFDYIDTEEVPDGAPVDAPAKEPEEQPAEEQPEAEQQDGIEAALFG